MVNRTLALATIALISLLGACQPSNEANKDPQSGNTDAANTTIASTDTQAVGEWQSIAPGGATTCSDGSDYKFFARLGNPQKLMVYLQGGGACWFRQNCDPQMQPTYTMNIAANFKPWEFGVFNQKHSDNPFKDYTVVYAPYCTGDVHLGARDTVYAPVSEGQEPLTIHHQGRANMQAVLDWTYANVAKAEQIFVTGSSAGAIPSPYYAAIVANAYPDAQVAQLGDGAGGYRRINEDSRPDEQWGTFDFLTQTKGFENVQKDSFNYEKLYIAAAAANPDILFAQYDAAEDDVQKRFLALSGSKGVQLLDALNANHADIDAAVPNFRSFITGGASHTILQRPEFYSYGAKEHSVADWVGDLANFKSVHNVSCGSAEACVHDTYAGVQTPGPMMDLWRSWEAPEQYVEPFQIFDNVYYVGIDWVAAYVIQTSDGLILVDSLYGKWIGPLVQNMLKLGLNPADVKYVINTHGHFDHAGGSAFFQEAYGAKVVMTEEDWQLAETPPQVPQFYMTVPERDIVAVDGDIIELGDTKIELFQTPGHTEGVLTLRYSVKDGNDTHTAISLGGVGLNFSGIERTKTYLESYARLQAMQEDVSVSLPNHAAMGAVFEKAALLKERKSGEPHPFVDPQGYQTSLATFISNAKKKLIAEELGTAKDPLEELTKAIGSD